MSISPLSVADVSRRPRLRSVGAENRMSERDSARALASSASSAFASLDEWVDANGWAGYDPYDIRGQGWYVKLFGSWMPGKLRTALFILERSFPQRGLRRFLRIKKEINCKGMGLLAQAYLSRFRATQDSQWLKRAESILQWLTANPAPDYQGMSWGYPFHWQSRMFFVRGTPSVVVTGTVSQAFLEHYEITGSQASADVLAQIAVFFETELNRPIETDEQVCFSYTPLDDFQVLNASLFAAAFFAQWGSMHQSDKHIELARKAAAYVIDQQNEDGSFYYWGNEPPTPIDHFHTGFVLRHLDTIRRQLDDNSIETPLARAHEFYLAELFDADGVPKHTPDSRFPINIHSVAEALLCLSMLNGPTDWSQRAANVMRFAQESMLHHEGWFVAEIRKSRGRELKMEVPFMRWSQAWMLLGFARVCEAAASSDLPEESS